MSLQTKPPTCTYEVGNEERKSSVNRQAILRHADMDRSRYVSTCVCVRACVRERGKVRTCRYISKSMIVAKVE